MSFCFLTLAESADERHSHWVDLMWGNDEIRISERVRLNYGSFDLFHISECFGEKISSYHIAVLFVAQPAEEGVVRCMVAILDWLAYFIFKRLLEVFHIVDMLDIDVLAIAVVDKHTYHAAYTTVLQVVKEAERGCVVGGMVSHIVNELAGKARSASGYTIKPQGGLGKHFYEECLGVRHIVE